VAPLKEHEKILQQVMRDAFRPAGLVQKGRSRVWFEDHGWWLVVIELQPSGWEKGSYLNVGAMWLVYPLAHVAFHDGYRRGGNDFVPFKEAAQFGAGVSRLCASALEVVGDLRRSIATYSDALARQEELLAVERARGLPQGPWNLYYTAAFAMLAGQIERARDLASQLERHAAKWDWEIEMKATALRTLGAAEPAELILEHVRSTRGRMKLPPWEARSAA
jgi:hypothetical protein